MWLYTKRPKLTNQKEKPNQITTLKYIYFLSHYL